MSIFILPIEAETPYTYKVLDGESIGEKAHISDISKIELPSRGYLPPVSHNTIHNSAPHQGGVTGHLRVPQQAYLPPSDASYYRLPKTYHKTKEPAKSYLPPAKSYLPPPQPPSKSYLPPPPASPQPPSLQPAYLQPKHGDDEVKLVAHNDVLTIALPLHSTVQPYSVDTKPTHNQFVPHKPTTMVHHQPTKAPQYHQHHPSPAAFNHHPTQAAFHQPSPAPPHPSHYPQYQAPVKKYPHHHPMPTPYPRHQPAHPVPSHHQTQHPTSLYASARPKQVLVHSLPPRQKFSIADYIKDDGGYDSHQNEVFFATKLPCCVFHDSHC